MTLSGNLIAKERRGAELIVQKKDGQQIRGELIAVKQNSLLLLVSGVDTAIKVKFTSLVSFGMWIAGGVLVVLYGKSNINAILALNIGASTPLIIERFASVIPEIIMPKK